MRTKGGIDGPFKGLFVILSVFLVGVIVGSLAGYTVYSVADIGTRPSTQAATSSSGFDFELSNSGDATAQANGAGNTTINVVLVSGQAEPVSLSCSAGLPDGAICLFTPSSGLPTFSSNLLIVARASPGLYHVTVTGSGGGLTRTTQFVLRVNPQGNIRLGGSILPIDFLRLLMPYVVVAAVAAASGVAFLGLSKRRRR